MSHPLALESSLPRRAALERVQMTLRATGEGNKYTFSIFQHRLKSAILCSSVRKYGGGGGRQGGRCGQTCSFCALKNHGVSEHACWKECSARPLKTLRKQPPQETPSGFPTFFSRCHTGTAPSFPTGPRQSYRGTIAPPLGLWGFHRSQFCLPCSVICT